MDREDTLRVRHLDSGEQGELFRFDPNKSERILVRRDGEDELSSEYVLDWEPVEGQRPQMYVWLSEKEDAFT